MPAPDRPDRLTRLRMAGLAASTVLAASAYGAGALPAGDADAAVLPDGPLAGSALHWLALTGWFGGLAALAGIWWRLGVRLESYAGRRGGAVTPGWLLRTALLWAAPLLVAPPTGSRDVYAYACQGALWLDGVDPYAVGVLPGGCVWSEAVPALWRNTPTPYGPLAVVLAGGAVALARLVTASTDSQLLVAIGLLRVVALGGVALVAGSLPRLARACGVDPVRATWLGLLSPLIMIHAVSGAHNDALMLGLVLAALSLAARTGRRPSGPGWPGERRGRVAATDPRISRGALAAIGAVPGWVPVVAAGVLLGLAVAVKVTAIVAVPFAILLAATRPDPPEGCLGSEPDPPGGPPGDGPNPPGGPPGDGPNPPGGTPSGEPEPVLGRVLRWGVVGPAGGLLGAGVLAFTLITVATGLDLGWVGALSDTGRLVQWTSLPTGLGMAAGYVLWLFGRPDAVDLAVALARLLGLVALTATVGVLLVRGWRAAALPGRLARRRLVVATGLALSALALLSPIFYPWYALTAVTVLAAGLADRRWTRRVAGLVVLASFLVLPGGLGLAVLTKLPGALLDVLIVAVLAVTAYRRWRARRWRAGGGHRDPDRAAGP